MVTTRTKSDYISKLCARVRELRLKKDWTQAEMAKTLGVSEEQYRKYETRTPLPHFYVETFARVTDTTIEYVLTGEDRRAAKPRVRHPFTPESSSRSRREPLKVK